MAKAQVRGRSRRPTAGSATSGGSARACASRCRRCCSSTSAGSRARRSRPRCSTSQDGADLVVVASQGGLPKNPQWYPNLVAHPDTTGQPQGREAPAGPGPDRRRPRSATRSGRGWSSCTPTSRSTRSGPSGDPGRGARAPLARRRGGLSRIHHTDPDGAAVRVVRRGLDPARLAPADNLWSDRRSDIYNPRRDAARVDRCHCLLPRSFGRPAHDGTARSAARLFAVHRGRRGPIPTGSGSLRSAHRSASGRLCNPSLAAADRASLVS